VVGVAAALLVPTGVVGGVTMALADGDSGDVTLKPGGSAVIDAGASFTDGTGTVTYTIPGRPAGDSLYLGLELRSTSGSLYRAKTRVFPDGTLSVDLSKVVSGGGEQFLGTKRIAGQVGTGSTALTLQGDVNGTQISVRAFPAGTAAPVWQNTATDTSLKSGSVRAWAYLSRKATAGLNLHYEDLSGKKPAPPVVVTPTVAPPTSVVATPTPSVTPTPSKTPTPTTPPATTTPPPVSPSNPNMAAVLADSGANLDTNYSVPSGAVFVSPSGSDSNSGSSDSPLRSIASAVSKAPGGGTVVLRGGTYREAVGSVGKRLTFQAYPHEKPVISGADVVSSWTASGSFWRATSWTSPFAQDQFRPDEVPSGTAAGRVEQAFRNGKALKQVMSTAQLKAGSFYVNPTTKQLFVADDPTKATMEVAQRTRAMTLESSAGGSKILGLRFTANAAPHLDNSGNLYVGSNDTLIENSQFDHSSGAGLKIAGSNITVNRITASDNAAEGMQGNRNDDSVVKNSQFLRNNTDGFLSEGCAMSCTVAGFKTAHSDNLKVIDNAFVDNVANGYWCDLGCTNGTITGNAVSGSFDGIFYEVSSKGVISDNYIEKSHSGIRVSGSDNVTISNNVLSDNVWQFTVYDDRRSASTDSYSASLGLTWNTTKLKLSGNEVKAGSRTVKLLEGNATAQVASPQMFSSVSGNSNSGVQSMTWCPQENKCKLYGTISEWKAASGLSF
jgi:parallel beta-helix repeat protein